MTQWSVVPLDSLAAPASDSFVDGPFGSDLKASEYVKAGVPVLRLQNIRANTFVSAGLRFITAAKARDLARHGYAPGDVVITKLGDPCGVACQVPPEARPGIIVADVVRFRPDARLLDPRYLVHFLNSPLAASQVSRMAKGTTRQRANLSNLKRIEVPCPALGEQRRIAAILDKADAIRRKREQAIQLTDDLLRSAFLEMFGDTVNNPKGWPQLQIGEMSEVQGGLQVTAARQNLPLGVPYLRVANVFRERLDLTEVKSIRVTSSELKRTALRAGDILLVEGHGNRDEIGRASTWDGSIEPCVHQNHLIRVRLDRSRVEPLFLSAFLNSVGGRRQLVGFGKTTSGLNTISTAQVKRLRVPVPPLDLQETWKRLSAQTEITRQDVLGAIEEGATLFNALVQRAFRGEL